MKIDKFKSFLKQSGIEILKPTNQYEVVRFRTENGVSIIYEGRKGFKCTGEAQEAYDSMINKNVWRVIPEGAKQKKRRLKSLIERDGKNCFFCGTETTDENRTIEHLLSVIDGGNNNLNNLAISCYDCNTAVGSMSIVDKITYRDTLLYGEKT